MRTRGNGRFARLSLLLVVAPTLTSPNDSGRRVDAELSARFAAPTSLAFQRFEFFDSLRWEVSIMRQPKPWYRKQTKSWYVQIDGKQINLGTKKRDAWRKYHKIMAGGVVSARTDTAIALLDKYLTWCEHNLAAATARKNRFHLKRFGAHIKPQLTATDVKPLHVQRWIDKQYRGKSSTYKNIAITAVKAAFNWAVEQGYLDHSPVARMKKPRCASREFFLPAVDRLRVLNAARGQQFKELVAVMFASGARPQEMRVIAARHFEPDLSRLVFLREESKGKQRRRVIYLDDMSREIVERLVAIYSRGPLFRNSRGHPWTADALSARFRRLKAKLGMPQLCAYTLRHSYAYWQLTAGTDSYVVGKLLGHRDGRMLETRYGHIDRDAAFMMDTAQRSKSPFEQRKQSQQT